MMEELLHARITTPAALNKPKSCLTSARVIVFKVKLGLVQRAMLKVVVKTANSKHFASVNIRRRAIIAQRDSTDLFIGSYLSLEKETRSN